MNTEILKKVQQTNLDKKIPDVQVGDTVEVDTIIRDGDKKRIQVFKGMVIAIKGSGTDKTFTVRKISYGVGVEKILPMYSTNISAIRVKKHAKVRRAKLFYMRKRIGKAAMKLKAGDGLLASEPEETKDGIEELGTEVSASEGISSVETNTVEETLQTSADVAKTEESAN
jgi:large subunit ribosomal protein L19